MKEAVFMTHGQSFIKKNYGMKPLKPQIRMLISMLPVAEMKMKYFPWDFLDTGVTKNFLLREWHNAINETVTPNCRMKCSGCGAASFGGGVCFEN